jgi:acyl carrier protein
MPATAFLQQPLRWLRTISRYHAQGSGGPNFAYELCVKKATPEHIAELDLSSWEVAFTGAEPIQAHTIERFSRTFAPCGFRQEAFYPCYGLAEATLLASGSFKEQSPLVQYFDAPAIERGQAVLRTVESPQAHPLVSSGHVMEGQYIEIVDPVLLSKCAPDQIGEIWISGPNIAQGYWNKSLESMQTFHRYVQERNERSFFKTGDLGFLLEDELFVVGRLKDVIIIRGRNLYPQDIEAVVEGSHPALRPGCCAAFSLNDEQGERLIIVQEIERHHQNWEKTAIIQAIRQRVAAEFDVEVSTIALLRAGTILKTTSGKIQRSACRQHFLDESLNIVYQWSQQATQSETIRLPDEQYRVDEKRSTAVHKALPEQAFPDTQTIVNWIRMQIAQRIHLDPQTIDPHLPFANYGLDSVAAVGLSGDLEQWLQRSFSPTLIYDYPSIDALAHYLSSAVLQKGQHKKGREEEIHVSQAQTSDAIAIIGIACRVPGAPNIEAFWQLLHDGVDAISEVPDGRWSHDAMYQVSATDLNEANIRQGGFLSEVDQFDPTFFAISPREATRMDPQQRLLLEVAWEMFEQANIAPDTLAGSQTGVFIGISSNDYVLLQQQSSTIDAYMGTGNAHSIAANRLSYTFNFCGPSMALDSACSSSLLALHQACLSIRAGECSVALAGGVNLLLTLAGPYDVARWAL